ncbi:hypothetical protein [Magnetospira sp. QH-2]|uniref:hypothetical protein n=1 Tax=Magnetospira sp. (strain QH-2) TaxID=1288970 RepID=UPI0003E812E4|nr:hypothetical protein [Magnetospira sp. QH-2]CCQ74658.1 protein of unknown function [Magnetospira sp. QH-2]
MKTKDFHKDLLARMEACDTADALNDRVLVPFVTALEEICIARGYLLNTFGERTNLAVTGEDDAPVIYDLIEEYLDGGEG